MKVQNIQRASFLLFLGVLFLGQTYTVYAQIRQYGATSQFSNISIPLPVWQEQEILTQAVKGGTTSNNQVSLNLNHKERLRRLLSVELNSNFQMGIDTIKSGPISTQKKEIIALSPHLQPMISSEKVARGYGIEVKIKFD